MPDSSAFSPPVRIALVTAALFLACLPFVAPEIPAGYDFPKQVLTSTVLHYYDDPELGYAELFEIDLLPRPTTAAYLLLSGLMNVFPDPLVAGKAYMALVFVGMWFFGSRFLKTRGVPDPTVAAVTILALSQTWCLYAGYIGYCGGLAVYCLALWVWFGLQRQPWRFAALMLLAPLSFLFHIVWIAVWPFTAGLLSLWAVWKKETGWGRVLLDAAAFLPGVGLLGWYFTFKESSEIKPMFYAFPQNVKSALAFNLTSVSDKIWWVLLPAFVLFCAAVAWKLWQDRRGDRMALVFVALLAVAFFMPIQLGVWWIAAPRTFNPAIIAGTAVLAFGVAGRRIQAAVSLTVLAATSLLNTSAGLQLKKEYDHFLSGLEYVEPGSYIMPIIRDPAFPDGGPAQHPPFISRLYEPFYGMGDVYCIRRGGATPYAFAAPHLKTDSVPLVIKPPIKYNWQYPPYGDDDPERYRGIGETYDAVLLYVDSPPIEAVLAEEMNLVFENPPLKIYRSRTRAPIRPAPPERRR